MNHRPLNPGHRMLLLLRYADSGRIADVEAIALPSWRDLDPTDAPPPLPPSELVPTDANEVLLMEVPGGSVVLRYARE